MKQNYLYIIDIVPYIVETKILSLSVSFDKWRRKLKRGVPKVVEQNLF